MALAGFVAAMAGVCLVGTAFIGPAAGRSARVHNHGGLDWDRPEFGRFGAFSSGMFGLWPVYGRAEGYDFGIIDRPSSVVGAAEEPGPSPSASETNGQRTTDNEQLPRTTDNGQKTRRTPSSRPTSRRRRSSC
jgi:hypothetical protein